MPANGGMGGFGGIEQNGGRKILQHKDILKYRYYVINCKEFIYNLVGNTVFRFRNNIL